MEYYKEIRKYVGHRPLILPGAVVLIQNELGEILLQERKAGIFGLPGGLMDLGESFEQTATREVFEETGLTVLDLQLCQIFSGSDFYHKIENGDEFYSVTAVYKTSSYTGIIKNNPEEAINLAFSNKEHLPDGLLPSHKKFIMTACL